MIWIIRILYCFIATTFSLSSYATQNIRITVKTNASHIAGIGYLVDGKKIGGPGVSYSGEGPINKRYVFGYRKSLPFLTNVTCGVHTLNKDSTILLVTDGKSCHTILKDG